MGIENITPLNLTPVTNMAGQEIETIGSIFSDMTNGWGGLAVLIVINIIFIVGAYNEKGMNLNFGKSLLGASILTVGIGLLMLEYGLLGDIRHLAFFVVEFGLAFIFIKQQKETVTG